MSHSVIYFPILIIEKEIKEKEIYIDLAMVASQWSEVAVHNTTIMNCPFFTKFIFIFLFF